MAEKIDFPIKDAFYKLNSDNKIELHIPGKDAYMALPEDVKRDIKSGFIWGRQRGAWVSRSKGGHIPYSMNKYNIKYEGASELKSFEESQEQKTQRLENKAERYSEYSANAEKRAEKMQSEFNKLKGDWSWITQPNVSSSAGRAFTNQRNRVMDRYEKGFEEYKKANEMSEYATELGIRASQSELKDLGYLQNRIDENKKIIKNFPEFEKYYNDKISSGQELSDETLMYLDGRMNMYKLAFDKYEYYKHYLDLLVEQKKEAGTYFDEEEKKKTVKKDFKEFLKKYYDINLLKIAIAYTVKSGSTYYYKTDKPLPKLFHSGFASDNVAQMSTKNLYLLMDKVIKEKSASEISEETKIPITEAKEAINIEEEHRDTVEKLASGEISTDEGIKEIAETHLSESKDYYDKDKGLPAMEKELSESEKEAWQMTQDEYLQSKRKHTALNPDFVPNLIEEFRKHQEIIKQALSEGKNVPPEILAEYPELKQPEQISEAKQTESETPIQKEVEPNKDELKFTYQMLDRLRSDCDYFLGNGGMNEKHLHQGSVDMQIEEMKRLYNSLPKDKKPDWLSMGDIVEYEKRMKREDEPDTKQKTEIQSIKKYNDSTCKDTYNFVKLQQEYCYLVKFKDGKVWSGIAKDIEEAKQKAIAEIEYHDKKTISSTDANVLPQNEIDFVNKLTTDTKAGIEYNKVKLEKTAREYGINEQNKAKELAELSISIMAREIASGRGTQKEKYDKIVSLYKSQVNLSHRTSESVLLMQYSTPAPIGYVAGLFVGFDKGGHFLEPSAGNGLLTIAGKPEDFVVNEIDPVRNRNLKYLGFSKVTQKDASLPFTEYAKKFDGIITNPPFGSTEAVTYGTTDIKSLEMLMALRGLDCMADNGKAAIIIGGHTQFDEQGRIKAGKNRSFFVYLYKHYNVSDVINIDGHALYSRQGTSFNVRLILINGRKAQPEGLPPLVTEATPMSEIESPTPVNDFDVLFERVMKSIDTKIKPALQHDYASAIFGRGVESPLSDLTAELNELSAKIPSSTGDEKQLRVNELKSKVNIVKGRLDEVKHIKGWLKNAENTIQSTEAVIKQHDKIEIQTDKDKIKAKARARARAKIKIMNLQQGIMEDGGSVDNIIKCAEGCELSGVENQELKDVLVWAKENLVGKKVYHPDIDNYITFSMTHIKHAIRHHFEPIKINLIYNAIDIIKTSKLYKVEPDRDGRKDILNFFKFICNDFEINGIRYNIYLHVMQTTDNHFYYENGIIKEPEVNTGAASVLPEGAPPRSKFASGSAQIYD